MPIAVAAILLSVAGPLAGGADAPLPWSYFGEAQPGRTPEVFAPELIPGAGLRLHGAPVVSPDLRRICWSVIPPAIMSSVWAEGAWSIPEPLPLPLAGVQAPAFSPDGRRLYFQGIDVEGAGGVDLWWVDLTSEAWSEPTSVGPAVNTPGLESQPSLAADGTLYYTGTLEGVGMNRGIYRALSTPDGFAPPELLGPQINTEFIDYCPSITPDGTCLLFASSRPSLEEEFRLFVAFAGPDGSWSEPVSLHEALGLAASARFPQVSPDGKYLFFVSEGRAYWVDFAVVPGLGPAGEGHE